MGCQQVDNPYFGTATLRHSPDELRFNNGAEPRHIDPGKCSESSGGEIANNLFSGLTDYDPATSAPVPDLATSWDISPDGLVYTFHLRPSQWNDGTPLTAHDFEWSWKRVLRPETESVYTSILSDIKGVSAVTQGSASPDSIGVHAIDDHTLRVELEHPVPHFLELVAYYTFRPVPRHHLEKFKAQGLDETLWTRPEYIVSNGPFNLKEWKFRQYFLLERNPLYWDAKNVKIKFARLYTIEEAHTALNMYRAGEIDWLGPSMDVPAEFIDSLKHYKDYVQTPHLGVYYYWLNVKKPPLDDVRVRKALALAIDRQSLVTHITRGGEIPIASLVPDGLAGYKALPIPLYDPDLARKLLAEAGYPGGKNFPHLRVIYNTLTHHKQVAEAIQEMWQRNLGIQIDLENREWKVFLDELDSGEYHIARMGWIGDYADPNTFLQEILASYSDNNRSGWKDPTYDRLLKEANNTVNRQERLNRLQMAESHAMDAMPLLPLYVYTRKFLVKPYVHGWHPNMRGIYPLKYFWLEETRAVRELPLQENPK